nr:nuclear pore complex protein nup62 [Quercus suber]
MGISVCAVFCSHHNRDPLFCWLTANGKRISSAPAIGNTVVLSDHIWLIYLLPQFYLEKDRKSLWEYDANGFSQISIYFGTGPDLEVKKCRLHMVCKNNIEDLNRAMAQSRNNSIIPHKGLDVLPQNFDNLVVVAERNKTNETRDDYDGAGPSGEGSSHDLPNPQRIETLTKFMDHGDSDCEEYLECGEEHNDWQESSESDLEGMNSEFIEGELEQMTEQIKSLIQTLNANQGGELEAVDGMTPLDVVVQILNNQLSSLMWVDEKAEEFSSHIQKIASQGSAVDRELMGPKFWKS